MAQPAVEPTTDMAFPEVDAFLDGLADKNGALIPTLHKAQETYGYLSKEVQLYIAHKLQIPAAKVYGVATFYSLFSMEKRGQYRINVCMGTACFVLKADELLRAIERHLNIKEGEVTPDGMFSIEKNTRCVGLCAEAPVVLIGDKIYGFATEEMILGAIDELKRN